MDVIAAILVAVTIYSDLMTVGFGLSFFFLHSFSSITQTDVTMDAITLVAVTTLADVATTVVA